MNSHPLRFLLGVFILLHVVIQAKGEFTSKAYRYFLHVPFRESPYEALVGIHETNQKVANSRNHFRFAYDNQGRIVEVCFMRDNKLVINTSHDNFFLTHSKITIDYVDNKERWAYYNFRNERIHNGPVYSAEYTLDNSGNRIALAYYNQQGTPVESDWNVARYTWERKTASSVKENRYNLKGEQVPIRPGFDFFEVRMEFDKRGYVSTLSNFGLEGKPTDNSTGVAYDKLNYNSKGEFIGWKVFNTKNQPVIGNYPLVAEGRHTYNEWGDNLKTETFDLQGNYLVASWGYAYDQKTYDAFGNMIEHDQYDQNKSLLSVDGRNLMYVRSEYNERNQIQRTSFMNKDRNLIQGGRHRVAIESMKYDEANRLVEVNFQDATGKPVESSWRGLAVEKYNYAGNTIDTVRLDADHNVMNRFESKLKKQLRPISYMIGSWQRLTYFSNGAGGWSPPLTGTSNTSAILNGRFLDEFLTNSPVDNEPQVSRNSIGINPETGKYRLLRLNGNSLGNMSVFDGQLVDGKLILDNLNDVPDGIPALRFTYSKSAEGDGYEQLVDRTMDKGKTWNPFYKIVYKKS